MSPNGTPASYWHSRAEELADWTEAHLVNRQDAFGAYQQSDGKVAQTTVKAPLTRERILAHFRAKFAADIIGLHAIAREPATRIGEVPACFSRWLRTDVDWHGDGNAPSATWRAAKTWHDVLVDLGFHPILANSNGRGGFWLDVIFDEPILALHARQLGRWLIRDYQGHGLDSEPEVFPKQSQIGGDGFGNWARLFGRHHKHGHWTQVWDGQEWIGGDEAIDFLINITGDSARLIPAEALAFGRESRRKGKGARKGPKTTRDAVIAKEALGFLSLGTKDEQGREFLTDYWLWLTVGMCLHELGDVGLNFWDEWSQQGSNYEQGVCQEKWETFHSAGESGVSLGTLFFYAEQQGWSGPPRRVKDEDTDGRPWFSNCRTETDEEEQKKYIPLSMPEIVANLKAGAGDWPKRVVEVLFVQSPDYRPVFLESSTQLFGWADGIADVCWASGPRMVGQERLFEHIRKFSAERFDMIESVPHYPPMSATYYMHPPVEPRNGGRLFTQLLKFFLPETDVDRELIRAAIMTPFWGGPPGKRPAFRIEGPEDDPPELGGRGTGKSTLPVIIAGLTGGYIDLEEGEEFPAFKTRLLSNEEGRKRIIRVDNIKTLRLSWAPLEAFITSPVISGHAMYRGEGQRSNTLTVFITVNGGSLSKDMAQRVIPIRLARPKYTPRWDEEIDAFINANRWELIAEIIGTLAGKRKSLETRSRWATWEKEVLGHCGLFTSCQETIAERIEAIDADDEEAVEIEAAFVKKLLGRGYNPDVQNIKIPVSDAAEWFSEYLKKPLAANTATGILRTKPLKRLAYKRTKSGRFWFWMGGKASDPLVDRDPF